MVTRIVCLIGKIFANDKVDAGDIGAGHTVTALYEVALVGSNGEMIPELRYQQKRQISNNTRELAFVRLRYKQPGQDASIERSAPITRDMMLTDIAQASSDFKFAAAVAGFGQLLKGGIYTDRWSYDDALNLARQSKGKDQHGYRGELVSLLELAKSLSVDGV